MNFSKLYLKQLNPNNQKGIEWLYTRYGKQLFGYAKSTWNLDEDSGWELVYKTFYKVAEVAASKTFETEAQFKSYLFKVFINFIKNHWRDTKNVQNGTQEIPLTAEFVASEEVNEESLALQQLKKLLDELPDWQRILVLLRTQGASYQSIAQYVDKPVEQLKVYYARIREKLSKQVLELTKNQEND